MDNQTAVAHLQDLEAKLRRDAAGMLLQADSVALAIAKLTENTDLKEQVTSLNIEIQGANKPVDANPEEHEL